MKKTKTGLKVGRLLISWTGAFALLFSAVYFIGVLTTPGISKWLLIISPLPLLVVVKDPKHFYWMKRNVNFDQYRLDK